MNPAPRDGSATASAETRVILVGRTGLDAALRLDPGIELVRARTPIDALGELADRIDEQTPSPVTLVLGPDADPGPRAASFIRSVRLIEPAARILIVGTATRGVYDGAIVPTPATTAATLRDLVRPTRAETPTNGAAHSPGPRHEPAPTSAPTRADNSPSAPAMPSPVVTA
ncbi:MAG: hypothetical protein H7Y88_13285, partial [Phycisphaerales bacterium]|nr:hypothetical protein [Phycisphaerales bacterium]